VEGLDKMAKIAKKVMWWAAVSDAASYNIRIIPDGNPFDYTASAIGVPSSIKTEEEFDLAGTALAEGIYDIYVSAVDAAGNESDPLDYADIQLDFTPPSAPSSGGFR
jgi:hypothetical protein